MNKANDLIDLVFLFQEIAKKGLDGGVPAKEILASKGKYKISTVRMEKDYKKILNDVKSEMEKEMNELIKKYN